MINKASFEELEQKIRNLEEDALQHQQTKKELQNRSEFERLVTMTSTNFINLSPDEIDDAINHTLQQIGEFADADRSYVFLFGDNGKLMDNSHEWCSEELEAQILKLKGVSVDEFKWSIEKIRDGEVFHVPCVADLPPEAAAEKAEFESEEIQSLVNVPMTCKGAVVGFLGLDFVRVEKSLEAGIITLLRIVGEIVASALERKRIEEALHKSEEKFRALVEATSDWVWEIDLNGRYTYTNPNVKKILGCKPDELIGMKAFDTLKADDAKRAGEKFKSMVELKKSLVRGEYVHTHKDGFHVIVETSAEPFFDTNGDLLGFRGIDRDITARKRMEEELRKARDELQIRVEERTAELANTNEALRESALLYRTLTTSIADGVIVVQDGKIFFSNNAFAKMCGYRELDEVIGVEVARFFDSDITQFFGNTYESEKDDPQFKTSLHGMYITKEGKKFWLSMNNSVISWKSNPAVLSTVRDITEKVLQERAVREEAESLRRENIKLRSSIKERYKFGKIIGKSLAMQDVYELILKAAATDSDVIILGESGTGKELVAEAIHDMSNRVEKPFITVNCSAIPENLIESEFFGHVKGAFTGAHIEKKGYLHAANGGTLFLDEVGEVGLNIQVKLLQAFENGKYAMVGDTLSQKSDFRLISATNKDLSKMVAKGSMREDFYYRISVIPIMLPPLRDRREDITLLIDHFLKLFAKGEREPNIPGKDMDILLSYNWPGNIRELQNVLQRFLAIRNFDFMKTLPEAFPADQDIASEKESDINVFSFKNTLKDVEEKTIVNALNEVNWNRTKAASMLGISRRTLFRRIKKMGLNGPIGSI